MAMKNLYRFRRRNYHYPISCRINDFIKRLTRENPVDLGHVRDIAIRLACNHSGNPDATLRACGYMDMEGRDTDIIFRGFNDDLMKRIYEKENAERLKRVMDDYDLQIRRCENHGIKFIELEFYECLCCGKWVTRRFSFKPKFCKSKICKDVMEIFNSWCPRKVKHGVGFYEWRAIYSMLKYANILIKEMKDERKKGVNSIGKNRNSRRFAAIPVQHDCRN